MASSLTKEEATNRENDLDSPSIPDNQKDTRIDPDHSIADSSKANHSTVMEMDVDEPDHKKAANGAIHQDREHKRDAEQGGEKDGERARDRERDRDREREQGINGHTRVRARDADPESDLSDPTSPPHSPLNLADEIVVSDRAAGGHSHDSPDDMDGDGIYADPDHDPDATAADGDESMVGTSSSQQHTKESNSLPKRKRTMTGANGVFSDAKVNSPRVKGASKSGPSTPNQSDRPKSRTDKPPRPSLASGKGIILGHWRDSPVPEESRKHAVIGFIDIRDRLRTRIQGYNLLDEHVSSVWPLAPKTGASWVTFDGIHFLPHLVGLDQLQVKEYVRLRLDASESTEEEKATAEKAAIEKARRIVRQSAIKDGSAPPGPPPQLAYGAELPEAVKRRRTSGAFTPASKVNGGGSTAATATSAAATPIAAAATPNGRESSGAPAPLDPLFGTRPTRILLGCWTKSEGETRDDRHAIYGILGANDMFRVKLVRETPTGAYKDGNFPLGAGALWVSYEEVDFNKHLRDLTRAEIKEYCRVRQYQLDQGETEKERVSNEKKAVRDAQSRVSVGVPTPGRHSSGPAAFVPIQPDEPSSPSVDGENHQQQQTQPNGRTGMGGQELRTSRRVEARHQLQQQQAQQQQQQHEEDSQPQQRAGRTELPSRRRSLAVDSESRQSNQGALQRTDSLAQREIARAEATQGRADLHATHRDRATAAAAANTAAAAAAATAAASGFPNPEHGGDSRFHQSDNMRRLNDVWARQESMRAKGGGEDLKIYDGIKYERKATGPFMGKLVSHGHIISIDGEDYVEYRVLTKPSFF